jgi:hypothetical protein
MLQRVITITVLVFACASTLSAQDRLFALLPQSLHGQGRLIEIDTRPGLAGRIRRDIPVPRVEPASPFDPVSPLDYKPTLHSIGSGRYLVWLSNDGRVVNLVDTMTSRVSTLPVLPGGSRIVAVDSGRSRVFADTVGETFILDGQLGTVRSVQHETSFGPFYSSKGAYASSIERLFIGRPSNFEGSFVVDVVDVTAGRLERTFPLAAGFVTGIAVDADGRRLFVAGSQELHVYDAQNGALLMQFPGFRGAALLNENVLQIDESRRRLFLTMDGPPGIPRIGLGNYVAAFDLDTLALLGVASDPIPPNWSFDMQLLAGPRSPLYIFNSFPVAEDRCPTARLEVYEPESGALRQRVDALQLWGGLTGVSVCRAHLALQSPPVPPTLHAPAAGGRQVTLSWTASYDALHYDIEAGSAPGLSDLAVSPGHTSTSLTIDGVPPGRYFVRVRAINWVGRSLPSNEVEIVVP